MVTKTLKFQIKNQSVENLLEIQELVKDLILESNNPDVIIKGGREVVDRMKIGKVTYQLEKVKCGKENCRKCKNKAGHGPYYYAYFSENGKTKSKYIGKKLYQ